VGDDLGNCANFEIPIATFQGLELAHFFGNLDPVAQILIFHFSS